MLNDQEDRKANREQMMMGRAERMEERRGKAVDRTHLTQMVATAMGGYFGSQAKERERKRKRRSRKKRAKRLGVAGTGDSSDDDDSSSSSS